MPVPGTTDERMSDGDPVVSGCGDQARKWCRGEDLNLHGVAPTWT